MEKPVGISFEIGKDDKGWFVYIGRQKLLHIRPTRHEDDNSWFKFQWKDPYITIEDHRGWKNARYGGLKLDLMFGRYRCPMPLFWKKEFWAKDYMVQEPVTNSWNSGNYWFILDIPYFLSPFISLCFGLEEKQPGFYLGAKTYEVNEISQGLGRYDIGNPEENLIKWPYPETVAWGRNNEKGNLYICVSASLRGDMVD